MEWLDKMNGAIDYIEENLTGTIDTEEVAKKACCSLYNFQRMFAFITDVSLAEYIRRRRLSQAALDLQRSEVSVLETALKYGYDSPVSFARAFMNLHGVNPKEARKQGVTLKNYPKLSFKISIKGVEEMKFRIEEGKEFRLVGAMRPITTVDEQNFVLIPKMWQDVSSDGTCNKIMNLAKPEKPEMYGVCCNFRKDEFDYMIAVESDKEVPEEMAELKVAAYTWVKFTCIGQLPKAQQDVWKRIYTEWFPTSGYEHADGPELEWYSNENMDSDSYVSEIWIPIKKC